MNEKIISDINWWTNKQMNEMIHKEIDEWMINKRMNKLINEWMSESINIYEWIGE